MATDEERRRNTERRAALGSPSAIGVDTRVNALGNPGGRVPARPAPRLDPGGVPPRRTSPPRPSAPAEPSIAELFDRATTFTPQLRRAYPGAYKELDYRLRFNPDGSPVPRTPVATGSSPFVGNGQGAFAAIDPGYDPYRYTAPPPGSDLVGQGKGAFRKGGPGAPAPGTTTRTMPNGDVITRRGNAFSGVGKSGNDYAPTGVNFATANEEFARANAIRQQMIDAGLPGDTRHGAIMMDTRPNLGPRGSVEDNNRQIQRLIGEMGRGRQAGHRTAIQALTDANQAMIGADTDRYQSNVAANAAMYGDATRAAGQTGLTPKDEFDMQLDWMKYQLDAARAGDTSALNADRQTLDTAAQYLGDLANTRDALLKRLDPTSGVRMDKAQREEAQLQVERLEDMIMNVSAGLFSGRALPSPDDQMANGGLIEGYAGGGAIPSDMTGAAGAMPMTGPMPGGGAIDPTQLDSAMKKYGQYAATAAANGVHPLGVDEYVDLLMEGQNMIQQHPGMVEGYAMGGAIPVAGQQVMDANMPGMDMQGTDSIPAVIDGQRPAALTSGEYVIPAEVVAAKGTEFFDKLVKQYLNPEG